MKTTCSIWPSHLRLAALAAVLLAPAPHLHAQTAEVAPATETAPSPSLSSPPASPKASGTPTATPAAPVVYRWKDAQGRVHFGDRAPSNAERVNVRNDTPSQQDQQAAQERLRAMQERSNQLAADRRAQSGQDAAQQPDEPTEAPAGETACQAKWRAYEESYACFNPYRLANGGIKAEAYKHCKSIPRPEPCEN